MAEHRRKFKRYKKSKTKYTTSFDILELGDAYIEWVEDFPSNSNKELEAREGYWIRKTDCVNKLIVGRTQREYYEENKEKLQQKRKEYYEENKEEILEKVREYREKNKEEIIQKKKEYYKENKEKILEKVREKVREKVECECGKVISRGALLRHKKSKIHKDLLSAPQITD
jgi:translation elongation factor EF-G